jgi:hypothetical protein
LSDYKGGKEAANTEILCLNAQSSVQIVMDFDAQNKEGIRFLELGLFIYVSHRYQSIKRLSVL